MTTWDAIVYTRFEARSISRLSLQKYLHFGQRCLRVLITRLQTEGFAEFMSYLAANSTNPEMYLDDQFVAVTEFSAMNSGIRIHPWEAG